MEYPKALKSEEMILWIENLNSPVKLACTQISDNVIIMRKVDDDNNTLQDDIVALREFMGLKK